MVRPERANLGPLRAMGGPLDGPPMREVRGVSRDSVDGGKRGRDLSRAAKLGDAALAMSAVLEGDRSSPFPRVSTDSRTVAAGDLFFCLRGPTFDGHEFVAAAAEAGAAGVVCERDRGAEARATVAQVAKRQATGRATAVLEVEDTLHALGDLAAWTRRGFEGPLVGVTGSNGKTTTKEMLRAIFLAHAGEGRVLATQGNLNNLIGVPLTIFGLAPVHAAAVIEMGMNVPGEIARLTGISAPTVGLITCVAEAHLEGLGSIEGVARAKGELFEGLAASAVAIVNIDDANIVRESARFAGRRITFGSRGDVSAAGLRCDRIDASTFELVYGGKRVRVDLPLGGRHNVQNALGAAAAAIAAGVEPATVARGLSSMKPPPMRMSARAALERRRAHQRRLQRESGIARRGALHARRPRLASHRGDRRHARARADSRRAASSRRRAGRRDLAGAALRLRKLCHRRGGRGRSGRPRRLTNSRVRSA